jgi:hypothetical protein
MIAFFAPLLRWLPALGGLKTWHAILAAFAVWSGYIGVKAYRA